MFVEGGVTCLAGLVEIRCGEEERVFLGGLVGGGCGFPAVAEKC